ncbi:RRQRL motif-containing zinc-binding protein [Streptomyces sp. NPDC021100]|uniref:RRQRL motif-containing zinc-binding protein n=1 Tax=Streptomyces sp. NPDC021100 TaxID=3365114 RepID=UPI0037BB5D33
MPRPNERFNDPDGQRFNLPTWPWTCGPDPAVMATYRQLRERGLRPGGQPVAGQLGWRTRRGDRFAFLYRVGLAQPVRPMTPARWKAIRAALRARRICPDCKTEKPYEIPRRLGTCNDCAPVARSP